MCSTYVARSSVKVSGTLFEGVLPFQWCPIRGVPLITHAPYHFVEVAML